jgi:hypothetical protein
VPFMRWGKIRQSLTGLRWHHNTLHPFCMLDNKVKTPCKHALTVFNIYCFSTTRMAMRRRLTVTSNFNCQSCLSPVLAEIHPLWEELRRIWQYAVHLGSVTLYGTWLVHSIFINCPCISFFLLLEYGFGYMPRKTHKFLVNIFIRI